MKAFRKQTAGFLNNVDATITGYRYTDEFNGKPFEAGRKPNGDPKFHSLFCVLSTRLEGAVEDAITHLFMGGFNEWEVSADGHTLTPVTEGFTLGDNTGFSTFLESLLTADPRVAGLLGDDDDTTYDLTGLIGIRVHFIQQVDEAATKKAGKVVSKKDPTKSYDRKNLVVDAVLELPKKAAGKAVGKTSTTSKAKVAKAAVDAPDANVDEIAASTLQSIVVANGGSIERTKLNMALLKTLLKQKDLSPEVREAVRQRAFTVDFLESAEGMVFDGASGLIALAE